MSGKYEYLSPMSYKQKTQRTIFKCFYSFRVIQYILIIPLPFPQILADPLHLPTRPTSYSFSVLRSHRVYSALATHSWAWDLPSNVVDMPSITSLRTTDFLSSGSYQLQRASWVEMGLWAYFLFSIHRSHLSWVCSGLTRAVPVSVIPCIHLPCCISKMLFLAPLALPIFTPSLPHRSLRLDLEV